MRRSTVLVLLGVCLLAARAACAQRGAADSLISRLAWGSVNVLVRADTAAGVHVWAETSPLAHPGQQLGFAAYFDPQTVEPWVNFAHAVISTTAPPPDSALALQTPPLTARDGSSLVVLRRRTDAGWEKRSAIFLMGREGRRSWSIDAERQDARRFLEVLFVQAARSRLVSDTAAVREVNPLYRDGGPQPLSDNPRVRFPVHLARARQSGEVWLSFVVLPDGAPDTTSFRVLLSDDPAFAKVVLDAFRRSRYQPGRVDGDPVAMRIYERVVFRVR